MRAELMRDASMATRINSGHLVRLTTEGLMSRDNVRHTYTFLNSLTVYGRAFVQDQRRERCSFPEGDGEGVITNLAWGAIRRRESIAIITGHNVRVSRPRRREEKY